MSNSTVKPASPAVRAIRNMNRECTGEGMSDSHDNLVSSFTPEVLYDLTGTLYGEVEMGEIRRVLKFVLDPEDLPYDKKTPPEERVLESLMLVNKYYPILEKINDMRTILMRTRCMNKFELIVDAIKKDDLSGISVNKLADSAKKIWEMVHNISEKQPMMSFNFTNITNIHDRQAMERQVFDIIAEKIGKGDVVVDVSDRLKKLSAGKKKGKKVTSK